jgi:hypothetical protein
MVPSSRESRPKGIIKSFQSGRLAQLPVFLDDFGAAKVIQLGERIEIAGVAMVISLKF